MKEWSLVECMLIGKGERDMSELTEAKLDLRQQALLILFKNFGKGDYSNQSIYECADDWCSKQVTTSGLVNYYKAYYTNR